MQITEDLKTLRRYLAARNIVREYEEQPNILTNCTGGQYLNPDKGFIPHNVVEAMIDTITLRPQSKLISFLIA